MKGVKNLFNTQSEAKSERDSLIKQMVLPYYQKVPHPTNDNFWLKLNPFNDQDMTYFQENLEKGIDPENVSTINQNYQKAFVLEDNKDNGSFFNDQSIFSIDKKDFSEENNILLKIQDKTIKNLFSYKIMLFIILKM